jgi:transposase
MKYSPEIKELVVQKKLSGNLSVKQLSDEFGISSWTIRHWLHGYQNSGISAGKEKRPQDWTPQERFEALLEVSRLPEDELGSWCRSKGLHTHHLKSWKQDAIAGCSNQIATRTKTDRSLEKENKSLKRELTRKEKALAEIAALLVLKKKADALWGESGDD